MSRAKRDRIVARLAMLCVLAGLHPLAWWEMSARDFEQAVRRKGSS